MTFGYSAARGRCEVLERIRVGHGPRRRDPEQQQGLAQGPVRAITTPDRIPSQA